MRCVGDNGPRAAVNIAEVMCWGAFADRADEIFKTSYAEQMASRPSPIALSVEMKAAYRQAALRGSRYWYSYRGSDNRYASALPIVGPESPLTLGVNCVLFRGSGKEPIAGILTTNGSYVGFFDDADIRAEDLNEGTPLYTPIRLIKRTTVRIDPLLSDGSFYHIEQSPAKRDTELEFFFEDGDSWKFAKGREMFYSSAGTVYRDIVRDFLMTYDEAWMSEDYASM